MNKKERNILALEYANKTILSPFSGYIINELFKSEDITIIKLNCIADIFEILEDSKYNNMPIFLISPDISNLNLLVKNIGTFSGLNYFIRSISDGKLPEITDYKLLGTVVNQKVYYWNIDIEVLEILIKEFENEKVKEVTSIIKKFSL